MLFKDRVEAGQLLASRLAPLADRHDVVVLALPRGGVPVGFEVAKALNAPLDVFVVRKLEVPGQEELAIGAIASGNTRVLNTDVIHELGMSEPDIDAVAAREELELQRREQQYRGNRGPLNVGRLLDHLHVHDERAARHPGKRELERVPARLHDVDLRRVVRIGRVGVCPATGGVVTAGHDEPSESVPTLNTKSRRKFPLASLIAEDQSKRVSRCSWA